MTTTTYNKELTQDKMFALLDKDIAFKDLDNEWKKSQEAHNQLTQKRANMEKELHDIRQQIGDEAINEWNKNKFIRTDMDIKNAVDLWYKNKTEAIIKYGHISDWNTTQVKDMSQLFYRKYRFNDDISKWDVSNVKDMSQMFQAYKWDPSIFNQDISGWDVSNVEDTQLMFYNAINFNCDLSRWDVKNVVCMRFMFAGAKKFDGNISNWVLKNIEKASAIKGIYEDCNISSENKIQITYHSYSWDEEQEEYNDEYDYADDYAVEEQEELIVSGENSDQIEIKEHNNIHDDYADGYDTEEEWSELERRMFW